MFGAQESLRPAVRVLDLIESIMSFARNSLALQLSRPVFDPGSTYLRRQRRARRQLSGVRRVYCRFRAGASFRELAAGSADAQTVSMLQHNGLSKPWACSRLQPCWVQYHPMHDGAEQRNVSVVFWCNNLVERVLHHCKFAEA